MTSIKSAFWNIVYGVFFAYMVVGGTVWLKEAGLLHPVPVGDMILMALAIFRLVRLVCYDVILKFVRDALLVAKPDSFFGTMSALVACPWCTGLWFSFFVVFAYYFTVLAGPIILIIALAGVASLFQVLANLIGWHAEGKKRQVLGADAHGSTSTCG